jgi:hypothetical protein
LLDVSPHSKKVSTVQVFVSDPGLCIVTERFTHKGLRMSKRKENPGDDIVDKDMQLEDSGGEDEVAFHITFSHTT